MVKTTGPSNPMLRRLIRQLREHGKRQKVRIWLDLAERLEGPSRSRAAINISQLNRHTGDGNTIVVPGKVLAAGKLSHPVSVAAFRFSSPARRKIMAAGGNVLTIQQLIEQNPSGKSVKLME